MRSEMFSVLLYCVVTSCSVMLYRVVLWWCDVKCLLFSPCCFVSFYCCDVMCAICFLFCFPVLRLMRCEISVLLRLLFCVLLWCDAKCFLFCFVWWYHVFCCYALLCCTVMMRCEMPSVFLRVVSFRSIVLWCDDVCLMFCCFVLLCCVLIFCSLLFYCVVLWCLWFLTYFINHHQRILSCMCKNVGRLQHFRHERGLVLNQIITGTNACKHSVYDPCKSC